jgi:hypothetical protein
MSLIEKRSIKGHHWKTGCELKDLVIMGAAWNTLCSNENPEDKARADTIGFRLVASTYKTVKKVEFMSTAVN